ncbi:MAG: SulP family inorganic anion transporter, partial [Pseudomonadota bacterium]
VAIPAPAFIIALTCLATLLAGLMQFAASFFRVGQLVRFVPYPVIAGFTHGISVILFVVYIPMVLGTSAVPRLEWPNWSAIVPSSVIVGAATIVVAMVVLRRWPRWPAFFISLAAGVAVHGLIALIAPGFAEGAAVLRMGSLPLRIEPPADWGNIIGAVGDPTMWAHVSSFAVALAAPFGSSIAQQAETVAAQAMRGGGQHETRETANLRFVIWSDAVRRGLEALSLGLGPGPHLKIPDEIAVGRRSSGGPRDVTQPEIQLAPNFEAHNTVLDIFVQGGLPALLCLAWLLGGIVAGAWRRQFDAVTTLVCGLAAYSLFHFILRQPVVWFALVVCLAATSGRFAAGVRTGMSKTFPRGEREPCVY